MHHSPSVLPRCLYRIFWSLLLQILPWRKWKYQNRHLSWRIPDTLLWYWLHPASSDLPVPIGIPTCNIPWRNLYRRNSLPGYCRKVHFPVRPDHRSARHMPMPDRSLFRCWEPGDTYPDMLLLLFLDWHPNLRKSMEWSSRFPIHPQWILPFQSHAPVPYPCSSVLRRYFRIR